MFIQAPAIQASTSTPTSEMGYPTRTAQLQKLNDWDLKKAYWGARMNYGHACGNDWRYARTMKQLANRIRKIQWEREQAYCGA